MRVAAIYDIHGNLPALEAVLHEIRQANVDRVVVGGDVFPGPMPSESLTRLLELDVPVDFIHGNGDREVLAQMSGVESAWYRSAPQQWREPVSWCARQLDPAHKKLIADWPAQLRMAIHGLGEVLFCHASPRNDTECFTRLTPDEKLLPVFASVNASFVVCGHTHMQFDRTLNSVRIVNAGSVGMPFGEPGADWLLLGPDVQLRHTAYDLPAAADRIRKTDYPRADEFAKNSVFHPPGESTMLEAFAASELS
jgi:putative phosphoesterase